MTDTVRFDGAALYRIVVGGSISAASLERVAGMKIVPQETESQDKRVVLEGRIRDQSQLNSVIDSLFQMHLAIINIERLPGRINTSRKASESRDPSNLNGD